MRPVRDHMGMVVPVTFVIVGLQWLLGHWQLAFLVPMLAAR